MKFISTSNKPYTTSIKYHINLEKEQLGRWTKKEHEQFLQGLTVI